MKVKYNSVGFFEMLCLLFIGLKLGGVITWSWFWVLSPILLPLLIVVGILLIWGVFLLIAGGVAILYKHLKSKR